jgi:hypothetical protein
MVNFLRLTFFRTRFVHPHLTAQAAQRLSGFKLAHPTARPRLHLPRSDWQLDCRMRDLIKSAGACPDVKLPGRIDEKFGLD